MSQREDQLRSALTPPSPGLRPVGPGLFVSRRSVEQIVFALVQAGKIDSPLPAEPPSASSER